MSSKSTGYIYVITNKAMPGIVKIGYSRNVSKRVNSFYSSNVPFPFEVYATLEGVSESADKEIHKMLPASLRVNDNREFFNITPEYAYDVLFQIAKIFNVTNKLRKWDEGILNPGKAVIPSSTGRGTTVSWADLGIKNGDKLVCEFDGKELVVADAEKRRISIPGSSETTSVSAYCNKVNPRNFSWDGSSHFTFNGRILADIAKEMGLRQ